MAEQQVDPLRRAPGPDGLLSGIKLRPIVSIRGMPPGRGLYPGDRLGSMT
jgi:hypothetical protein